MTTFTGQQVQGTPQYFQQIGGQGQGTTGISVTQVPSTQGQRQLTGEAIRNHAQKAANKGPVFYWQVNAPSKDLKLTGAIKYVNRYYPNVQGYNRFVYWPDYRVSGTISEIVRTFQQAGVNQVEVGALNELSNGQAGQPRQNVQISEEIIASNAFDPLNPAHQEIIEQFISQVKPSPKAESKYTLQEFIQIGKNIKAFSSGSTTVEKAARSTTARTGAGARSPESNRQRLINDFSQKMQMALQLPPGQDVDSVLNVTDFDVQKFTKARKANPPGPRATAIRPYVNTQRGQVAVPIIAQPQGASNFQNFVRTVVANSPYGQYADEIIRSFQQQLQQRQAPQGMAATALGGAQQPQQQFTGFQKQQPQQQFTGFQTQQPMGATSPTRTTVGGQQTFQAPQTGGQQPSPARTGVSLPAMGGQQQQPSPSRTGGVSLPAMGGQQQPSPSRTGGVSLPQAGGVSLPPMSGQSPGTAGSPAGSPSGSPAGSPRGSPRRQGPLPTIGQGVSLPGQGQQTSFPSVNLPGQGQ
jgi:hypothetical protein